MMNDFSDCQKLLLVSYLKYTVFNLINYLPIARGGREVKSKLYSIRYIWSIMTVPEKPQYS